MLTLEIQNSDLTVDAKFIGVVLRDNNDEYGSRSVIDVIASNDKNVIVSMAKEDNGAMKVNDFTA